MNLNTSQQKEKDTSTALLFLSIPAVGFVGLFISFTVWAVSLFLIPALFKNEEVSLLIGSLARSIIGLHGAMSTFSMLAGVLLVPLAIRLMIKK